MELMELIERVAAAIRFHRFERNGRGFVYDPEHPLHENELADAKAAIRAMLDGVEPVAWRYAHNDYAGRRVFRYGSHAERVNGHDPIDTHPLYSLDALKEALGDE